MARGMKGHRLRMCEVPVDPMVRRHRAAPAQMALRANVATAGVVLAAPMVRLTSATEVPVARRVRTDQPGVDLASADLGVPMVLRPMKPVLYEARIASSGVCRK